MFSIAFALFLFFSHISTWFQIIFNLNWLVIISLKKGRKSIDFHVSHSHCLPLLELEKRIRKNMLLHNEILYKNVVEIGDIYQFFASSSKETPETNMNNIEIHPDILAAIDRYG